MELKAQLIKWLCYFILFLFFVYFIFGDISVWWCNFFESQARKLDLGSTLSLILSSSLAWLINQAELKLFSILMSSSLDNVFKLVLNLNQVWAFNFYLRVKIKLALGKLVYTISAVKKKAGYFSIFKQNCKNDTIL